MSMHEGLQSYLPNVFDNLLAVSAGNALFRGLGSASTADLYAVFALADNWALIFIQGELNDFVSKIEYVSGAL